MYVTIIAPNFSLSLDLHFRKCIGFISGPPKLPQATWEQLIQAQCKRNTFSLQALQTQFCFTPTCKFPELLCVIFHFWILPNLLSFFLIISLDPIGACSRAQQHIISKRWETQPPHTPIWVLSGPSWLPAKPWDEFEWEQLFSGYRTDSHWCWLPADQGSGFLSTSSSSQQLFALWFSILSSPIGTLWNRGPLQLQTVNTRSCPRCPTRCKQGLGHM